MKFFTIRNHRKPILAIRQDEQVRTVTRKGKTYQQKTANIGKSKAA